MAAAIYDSINGENKDHFLAAHSELSEHDSYAPAEHYYGLQEFEVDLYLNVSTEIIKEILNSELLVLPEGISRKITSGEYCFKTAHYADPTTFNELEWSVIRKYDSFIHHSIEEAYREYDAAVSSLENRTETVTKARGVLELTSNDDLTHLLNRTKELIKNNPSQEIAYWEAYWVLRDEPSIERLKQAEIQRDLAEEIQTAVEKLHWPKDWKLKYAPVWLSLGGDALTADRWFEKGWTIETILFKEQLPSAWNGTLTERVRQLRAPDLIDFYDYGSLDRH